VEDEREDLLVVSRVQHRICVVATARAEFAQDGVRLHRKQSAAYRAWRDQAMSIVG
jgi:hypothetical protein